MRRPARGAAAAMLLALALAWLLLAALAQRGGGGAGAGSQPPEPPGPAAPEAAAPTSGASAPRAGAEQAAPLPACEVADEPAPSPGLDDWAYTLLDTRFRLPDGYAPPDLVDLAEALSHISRWLAPPGKELRAVVIHDLEAFLGAAEDAGVALEVQSAYRSHAYQERTFAAWSEAYGYEEALRSSARPGHSEHQLGTTFDLKTRGGPAPWDLDDWATTPEGAWVMENAWRYGFVMSYPMGKEEVTCYMYEPWHYRYLGRELAAEVHASGLTPREYLWGLAAPHGEE